MNKGPGHYIRHEHCDSLLEQSDHANLNHMCELPEYSAVLDDLVEERGEDEARDIVLYAHNGIPFVFWNNFLLANFKFFTDHFEDSRELWEDIATTIKAGAIDSSETDGCLELVRGISILFRDSSRLGGREAFFGVAEYFLRSLRLCAQQIGRGLTTDEYFSIVELVGISYSPEDFFKMAYSLSCGNCSSEDLSKAPGVKFAKFNILGIKILDGCTIQCSFCSEQSSPHRDQWNLVSVDQLEESAGLWKDTRRISISGGEPCDHPQLLEILKFFHDKNIQTSMVTTGADMETLKALLPELKEGKMASITLSVNDFYGEKGRRRGSQTAAFLIKHNIPFSVNCGIRRGDDPRPEGLHIYKDLAGLGLENRGIDDHRGKLGNGYSPVGAKNRNPLVHVVMRNTYPAGEFSDDEVSRGNAEYAAFRQKSTHDSVRNICLFGNSILRADGTVSPCDHAMEGGDSGVPRLMDRWPNSGDELERVISSYRKKMERVWEVADEGCEMPCFAHKRVAKEEW